MPCEWACEWVGGGVCLLCVGMAPNTFRDFWQASTGETLQAVDDFVSKGGFDAVYALGMLEATLRLADAHR